MSENELKRALVAGASAALKHKEKEPSLTDEEIIKKVVRELRDMIEKMD